MALNVVKTDSDYKIKIVEGGTITLDTGVNIGEVYVTGNLRVDGTSTVINSQDLDIFDNIITLNKGEIGIGVTKVVSGIQIDRGIALTGDARFFWDESQTWNDPITQTIKNGVFVFTTESGGLNGIRTNSIDTNGGNLYLINKSTGVISVSGTIDYERQILNYNQGLTSFDKDLIPNIQAVTDKITFEILNNPSNKIKVDDTEVVVQDNTISRFVRSFTTFGVPSTQVRILTPLITNRETGASVGQQVTITNAPITELNGTFTIVTANVNDEFFVISVGTTVTLSNAQSSATVILNDIISNVKFKVDNVVYGTIRSSDANFYDINIQSSTISSTTSDDLILSSPTSKSIQIQENLKFPNLLSNPTPEVGTVKLYSAINGAGQTGLYFTNTDYTDELISKKKAIAFSILM
jgi:hypothetical protein